LRCINHFSTFVECELYILYVFCNSKKTKLKEQLEYFIRLNISNPIDHEIAKILEIFEPKEFNEGDFFKRSDQICNKIGFLVEGSASHFGIKKNGERVTGRISQKHDFITDLISVRTNALTPISISFLEPAKVLVASTKDMKAILEVNLTCNRLMREYMADNVIELGKMYMLFLTGSAKERYQYIIENNPGLLKNIPLRFIASMIGITPTQLSRIRNKKKKKKK